MSLHSFTPMRHSSAEVVMPSVHGIARLIYKKRQYESRDIVASACDGSSKKDRRIVENWPSASRARDHLDSTKIWWCPATRERLRSALLIHGDGAKLCQHLRRRGERGQGA